MVRGSVLLALVGALAVMSSSFLEVDGLTATIDGTPVQVVLDESLSIARPTSRPAISMARPSSCSRSPRACMFAEAEAGVENPELMPVPGSRCDDGSATSVTTATTVSDESSSGSIDSTTESPPDPPAGTESGPPMDPSSDGDPSNGDGTSGAPEADDENTLGRGCACGFERGTPPFAGLVLAALRRRRRHIRPRQSQRPCDPLQRDAEPTDRAHALRSIRFVCVEADRCRELPGDERRLGTAIGQHRVRQRPPSSRASRAARTAADSPSSRAAARSDGSDGSDGSACSSHAALHPRTAKHARESRSTSVQPHIANGA